MSEQIPLIEVPVLQRFRRPAEPQTVYLVAAYLPYTTSGGKWKIWPDLCPSVGVAEKHASQLAACWTHIRILGPVVLE